MPTPEFLNGSCNKVKTLRNYHDALTILKSHPSIPELREDRIELIHSKYHGPKIKGKNIEEMGDRQLYCIANSVIGCAKKTVREAGIYELEPKDITDVLRFKERLRESQKDGTIPPQRDFSIVTTCRSAPYDSPLRNIVLNLLRDRRSYAREFYSLEEKPTEAQGSLF